MFTHTTRDGDQMLIAQMDSRHLLNTIRLFIKRIDALSAEGFQSFDAQAIRVARRSGLQLPDEATARLQAERQDKAILETWAHLHAYMGELLLRDDIEDETVLRLRTAMRKAMGRQQALPRLNQLQLAASSDLRDTEDYVDDDDVFEIN